MTFAVLDDHLLRDVLSDDIGQHLSRALGEYDLATTNLYYVRLCRSAVRAQGGQLTGGWSSERRRALGRSLLSLPESMQILPMRQIGYRMAELADSQRLSTLGAEAVAAAEYLGGPLFVWDGDDGAGIRRASHAVGVTYRTFAH